MNTAGDEEGSSSVGGDISFVTAQNPSETSSRPSAVPTDDVLSPKLVHSMRLHALLEFVWGLQWTNAKSSERAESVAEVYAANLHSRRCDAARERKSALCETTLKSWLESPKYWPLDLERWLSSTDSRSDQMSESDNQLTSYSGVVWLGLDDIDTLATFLIGDILQSNHRDHLFDRLAKVPYTVARGLDKHIATARLKDALSSDLAEVESRLTTCSINYCILAFECPEFFGADVKGLSASEIVTNLQNLSESPAGSYILPAFVNAFMEGNHQEHLSNLWNSVFESLKNLRLTNLVTKGLNLLTACGNVPALRELLVQQSFWLSSWHTAYSVLGCTLLGRLIGQVSLVDWDLKLSGQATAVELKPLANSRGSSPALPPFLQRIKLAHSSHVKLCVQFLKSLLKHGGAVKQAVLDWFSFVLEKNLEQSKFNYRHAQSGMVGYDTRAMLMVYEFYNLSPPSASFNICWILLELSKPITLEKITEVDALYGERCRSDKSEPRGGLLGKSWLGEARMKSDEDLDSLKLNLEADKSPKFITQIFWLTLKAQKMLFSQCVNDALQRQINLVRTFSNASENESLRENLLCHSILWQSLFRVDEFFQAYMHFMDLLNAFIARAVFLKVNRQTGELHPHPICKALGIPASLTLPETDDCVSVEFQSLPVGYVSDAYEAFSKFIGITSNPALVHQTTVNTDNIFCATGCELFALVLLTILGGSDHLINAPPLRMDIGGRCIAALEYSHKLRNKVYQTYVAQRMLAPSICLGFVHAQKLSYYLRIDMRLILTRELERLLSNEEFCNGMDEFAATHQSDFERFLLFFASNTSYVLEEALTYLTEIKSRENRPQNNNPETSPNNAQIVGERQNNEEFSRAADRVAQEIEGTRNVEEMDFEQLTTQCQNFMDAGSASLNAFSQLDARCFQFIRNNKILVDPTVSCLDSCLASLVGPKCMALKVTNFDKYKFKPRELLADLVKIYVKLLGDDSASQVLRAIRDDQRYYSKQLFDKATRIVMREGLATEEISKKFASLVEQLNAGDEEYDWIDELVMSGEVPDEFIDPLMSDVMRDPVLLPTSNVIVERSVIERHLLSDQFDPFNRTPLDKSMLVAKADLKHRIEEFLEKAKQNRQQASSKIVQ